MRCQDISSRCQTLNGLEEQRPTQQLVDLVCICSNEQTADAGIKNGRASYADY
mgnify:CR=1 FL=1